MMTRMFVSFVRSLMVAAVLVAGWSTTTTSAQTPTPTSTTSAQTPTPTSTTTPTTTTTTTGVVDPAALVQQLIGSINAGNVDAAMALYTNDAVWQDQAFCATGCVGTAALRAATEKMVADHLRMSLSSPQVSGNTVTGKLQAITDSLRASGVEQTVSSFTAEARGDKIASVRLVIETVLPQTGSGGISASTDTNSAVLLGIVAFIVLAGVMGLSGIAMARRRR